MRAIPPATRTVLNDKYGLEPVNILGVQWIKDGPLYWYADKDIELQGNDVISGSILEISTLESVIKLDSRGQTQTITLKLSDTGGNIKTILNEHDIHGCTAKIYQWFDNANLPLSEKFLLFEGVISSNIEWREGDRTLSLEIITPMVLSEVGYSLEEGMFYNIPHNLVGVAWPLCFGSIKNVRAARLVDIPQSQLKVPVQFGDPTIAKREWDLIYARGAAQSMILWYGMGGLLISSAADDAKGAAQGVAANGNRCSEELANLKVELHSLHDYSERKSEIEKQIREETIASKEYKRQLVEEQQNVVEVMEQTLEVLKTQKAPPQMIQAYQNEIDHQKLSITVLKDLSVGPTQETIELYYALLSDIDYVIATGNKLKADIENKQNELQYWQEELSLWSGRASEAISMANQMENLINGELYKVFQIDEELNKLSTEAYAKINSEYAEVLQGKYFPQNQEITVQVEDVQLTGVMSGNTFEIETIKLLNFTEDYSKRFGSTFYKTGTRMYMISETNITYIVNILPSEITGVKAWLGATGTSERILTVVPRNWYEVKQFDIEGYTVTGLVFSKPLSTRDNRFEDEIYVSMVSSVGPNTVDIIRWLINKYTNLGINEASFSEVKECLIDFSSNFAIIDRKEIFSTLEEIAFQARCSIWVKDRIFYLKYLPKASTPVKIITEDSIDAGSLVITTTKTEELITKYKATWKRNLAADESNNIILRYNVSRYGMLEKTQDFYIYNIFDFVLKSSTFWMIRYANVWKVIRFTTYLDNLEIETFDTITLDLKNDMVASGPVDALVTALNYDSDRKLISIECWSPVRMGEMQPYIFSLPSELGITVPFPPNDDIEQEYPGGASLNTNTSNEELNSYVSQPSSQQDEWVAPTIRSDWGYEYMSDSYTTANIGNILAGEAKEDISEGIEPRNYLGVDLSGYAKWAGLKKVLADYRIIEDGVLPPPVNISIYSNIEVVAENPMAPAPQNIPVALPRNKFVPMVPGAGPGFIPPPEPGEVIEARVLQRLHNENPSDIFPGQIIEGSGDTYNVNVYYRGKLEPPTPEVVYQLQIDGRETIPPGTWVYVIRITTYNENNEVDTKELTMQVPIWL
jgi:hypothetical protein